MAVGHEFKGYVFINAREEQQLHLGDSEFALGACGDEGACACDEMCGYDFEEDIEDAMRVPILRSYQGSPSAGKNLTGNLEIVKQDLLRFQAGGLRITDWNYDKQDGADIYNITPPVELRADNLKAKLTNEPEDDVCTDIAEALDSEIQRLRDQWGQGADTKLNAAVNEALLRTQNPTTNLDGVFKLKKFVVGAGQAILGLGTNMAARKFSYNHGATIIFNPFRVRVTKTGKSKIKCTITNRDGSQVVICAKGFIFYSTRSNGGDASLPLSFFFRPDDTYTSAQAQGIADEIMSAHRPLPTQQTCSAEALNGTVLEAFDALRNGTGWTQSPILTDGEGIKVRASLASPNDRSAGVFKIRFSFTFGEQNGSLTIGNMFVSFMLDIQNYAANVNTVQQFKARVREYAAKFKEAMDARALALATANASAGGAPGTTPGTNLTIPADITAPSNNYATRPESVPNLPPNINVPTQPPIDAGPVITPVQVNPNNGININPTVPEALEEI